MDITEDWLKKIAWFAAEVLLQEIPPEKAQEIAGPNAFWPILNKQQLYDSVYLDIAAGSTGMPDTDAERMRWTELMPMLMQGIQFVQQLRQMGIPDQFNPYIQLLEETFKRFDERIDIAKFLPPIPEEMQTWMMQNQAMQAAMGQSSGTATQPPQQQPPQQVNEAVNAPENRTNQRLRNNNRQP